MGGVVRKSLEVTLWGWGTVAGLPPTGGAGCRCAWVDCKRGRLQMCIGWVADVYGWVADVHGAGCGCAWVD